VTDPASSHDVAHAVEARVDSVELEPLDAPLREPFVIATGQMLATRAVWVRVRLRDRAGRTAVGWGEAAALPPVTWEDQPDLMRMMAAAGATLTGASVALGGGPELAASTAGLTGRLDDAFPTSQVARAAMECAILDASARLAGCSVAELLGAPPALPRPPLVTDVTLPIGAPEHMAGLATGYRQAGFLSFKVKVGRDWRSDLRALRAVVAAVPDARFRLDANAGFTFEDASSLLRGALDAGMRLECFEQPCARDDWSGMARMTAESTTPIVADESFRSGADLDRLLREGAAHGVNLKLAKLGGPLAALALGRRARRSGLLLMAGAMVETRLGLMAMAHVVAALEGVDFVDLDTAFLLRSEPFVGGWSVDGPRLTLLGGPGLGLELVDAR